MYYRIKGYNEVYKIVVEADETGLCQVVSLNDNMCCLVRKEHLIPTENRYNDQDKIDALKEKARIDWKISEMNRRHAEMKEAKETFYKVGF